MPKTIGVIGLGSIGLRHAKNLRALGHLVRAWDPDMVRRLMFDGVLWDMDEVCQSDAFVVASPTKTHADYLFILNPYMKPIFIEKPVADQWPVFAGNVQMVGYNLRFHACVRKAKEWLDAGLIGTPLWANFTCGQYNDRPHYLRDGVILNWSHELDLALYLLGPAMLAGSSTHLSHGEDDITDILLTHEYGCHTSVHLDYVTTPELRGFVIGGSKGRIMANLPARSADRDGAETFWDKNGSYDQDYKDEMQAFIDRIDGKETIGCTGPEALKVLEICLEVRRQAGLP